MNYLLITEYIAETLKILLLLGGVVAIGFFLGILRRLYRASQSISTAADKVNSAVSSLLKPASHLTDSLENLKSGVHAAQRAINWFKSKPSASDSGGSHDDRF